MRSHILAEAIEGTRSWLADTKRRMPLWFRTLTIAMVLVCAFTGYYFLGFLGTVVGILVAVGMMDEMGDWLFPKATVRRKVYCPQCGLEQEWAEAKQCERCWSPLRKSR